MSIDGGIPFGVFIRLQLLEQIFCFGNRVVVEFANFTECNFKVSTNAYCAIRLDDGYYWSSPFRELNRTNCPFQPGFHIVVPVARIVSVASNFWKRQGRSYGNALAITQDDPCDRNDQSSEIDSSSIFATETTGNDSQAIAYF